MKTTHAERIRIRRWAETRSYKAKDQSLPATYLNLLDDLDSLESRLAWAEGMIERAKSLLYPDPTIPSIIRWISDLEKGDK